MRAMVRSIGMGVVVALLVAGCSRSDDRRAAPAAGEATTTTTAVAAAAPEPTGDLGDCPKGYADGGLGAGRHEGFASGDQDRAFELLLPDEAPAEPSPLFVALTGTVQEERAFLEQSGLDELPADGWTVVAPVRNENGLVWGPWDAMRTPAMTGPNPDEAFVLDLVACISAHHAIDPARVFVGGISIGGTFVNYLLRRNSDVFAGGIAGSGNLILTEPLDPEPLDPMTVIVAWGGDGDQWIGCPDGRMGDEYADEPGCVTADFVADAAAAIDLYSGEPAVRTIACQEDVGHIWISHATPYWADLLAASPKGTEEPVELDEPPAPLECEVASGA